jgi:hypothetical protein
MNSILHKNNAAAKPLMLQSKAKPFVQAKLTVNEPGDIYEQEADTMAEKVMRSSKVTKPVTGLIGKSLQRKCAHCDEEEKRKKPVMRKADSGNSGMSVSSSFAASLSASKGGGSSLPHASRSFMENAFSADFSGVRVHTDGQASEMSKGINAKAFTTGNDIYFKSGEYTPNSEGGKKLLAHELTHVVQQNSNLSQSSIQRVIELRPPGRGEASAFDRAGELIDRLNAQSSAIQYTLDVRTLRYNIVDAATLTAFDRMMRDFIDNAAIVPMRLITSQGRIVGPGFSSPVIGDAAESGYVDLDDMLATDDLSFQSILVHFLTERFNIRNYERRIGTAMPEFNRAHEAGHTAQAQHLRDVLSDPSIVFNYEEPKPNGDAHIVFRSTTRGYRVFLILRHIQRAVMNSEIRIFTIDRRWLSVSDFLAERAAAPAPAGAPAAPAAP